VQREPVDDLIYDIGMHQGEDTAYYLAKGYRVVAIEANPELAAECREKFAASIANGKLTLVEGAIADTTEDTVSFYVNQVSGWSSIDPHRVEDKYSDPVQREVSVPVVDLAACMRDHGVPHYLKIDIEGADRLCLEALRDVPVRPPLISMEAEGRDFDALLAELQLLEQLGYRQFAAVQQGRTVEIATRTLSGERLSHRFPPDSSGPFGDDLEQDWRSRDAVVKRYRRAYRRFRIRGALARRPAVRRALMPIFTRSQRFRWLLGGYYDTHARL
jgi:FkbM family methyltransferase